MWCCQTANWRRERDWMLACMLTCYKYKYAPLLSDQTAIFSTHKSSLLCYQAIQICLYTVVNIPNAKTFRGEEWKHVPFNSNYRWGSSWRRPTVVGCWSTCMRMVRSWTVQRRNTLTASSTARSHPATWRWSSSVDLRMLMGTNRVGCYNCITYYTYLIFMSAPRFTCECLYVSW